MKKNASAVDRFVHEMTPPIFGNNSIEPFRCHAKVVKVYRKSNGFIVGKALAKKSIGIINFNSYAFHDGSFCFGPLKINKTNPCDIRVNDYLFGIVFENNNLKSYYRCTKGNRLMTLIQSTVSLHAFSIHKHVLYRQFDHYCLLGALLMGDYMKILNQRKMLTKPDQQQMDEDVLSYSICCCSAQIFIQYQKLLKKQLHQNNNNNQSEGLSKLMKLHVENQSISAFLKLHEQKIELVSMYLKNKAI